MQAAHVQQRSQMHFDQQDWRIEIRLSDVRVEDLAIDKVNSQIRKLQNQISNNYSSIKRFSCNIDYLNNQMRYVDK